VTARIAARVALLSLLVLLVSSVVVATPVDGHGENGAHGHGDASAEHEAHHVPSFDDINWYHGLLFESEGAEPSLLVRPKGMPVPFLGYALNAFILYAIIYRFAKQPLRDALTKRKARIESGMKEAAAHRADAQARLEDFQHKLSSIEEEVERVRRDMRAAGEAERARVIADAHARRERMERDARLLVEQEFAATRENLTKEMVKAALRSASAALEASVTPQDHARLADEYLARLPNVRGVSRAQARGGSSA
jgi:F-type H+-transporting ATPase subunit b